MCIVKSHKIKKNLRIDITVDRIQRSIENARILLYCLVFMRKNDVRKKKTLRKKVIKKKLSFARVPTDYRKIIYAYF